MFYWKVIFRSFYLQTNFADYFAQGSDVEENECMSDFKDGLYCRNHPLFKNNKKALQIQLYYDGFEITNPLGSKVQKHNIGIVMLLLHVTNALCSVQD